MILLESGPYRAEVNPVGASLASLTRDGRDLVLRQDGTVGAPHFRGALLAPWPGRIADGEYAYQGEQHRLEISEPERRTALHGLVCDRVWEVAQESAYAVTLTTSVGPSPGYPFALDLAAEYTVGPDGLRVALRATNTGELTAPYGCGFHPYLRPETATIDSTVLSLGATELVTTDSRLLPTGAEPVPPDHDFSTPRALGDLALDHAYRGPVRAADGLAYARFGTVEVWWDHRAEWVQLFTTAGRDGLAVEPYTCPSNAFRTGIGLVELAPGEQHELACGIRGLDRQPVESTRTTTVGAMSEEVAHDATATVIGPDGEPVQAESVDEERSERSVTELVEQPAKVMRIGSMIRQLLEEVKAAPLDEASRARLADIHSTSISEIKDGLAPELVEELERLSLPFSSGSPSEAELRVAQAQLVGWLEGLFHGIQTAIYAQQMAAQSQLQQMRRALPPGHPQAGPQAPGENPEGSQGGGMYL